MRSNLRGVHPTEDKSNARESEREIIEREREITQREREREKEGKRKGRPPDENIVIPSEIVEGKQGPYGLQYCTFRWGGTDSSTRLRLLHRELKRSNDTGTWKSDGCRLSHVLVSIPIVGNMTSGLTPCR